MGTWLVQQLTMANEKEIQENRVSWEELRRKGKKRQQWRSLVMIICVLWCDGDRLTDIWYSYFRIGNSDVLLLWSYVLGSDGDRLTDIWY